jgi:DNA-binding MarR family transcriptional regulator
MVKASKPESGGRFAYEGLDRVIHERARLSILTSLMGHKGILPFTELKRLCSLSDGNLSRHLQILVDARLIQVSKSFENNRPQTRCALTALGRKRYLDYLDVLEQVVRDATTAASKEAGHRLVTAKPATA